MESQSSGEMSFWLAGALPSRMTSCGLKDEIDGSSGVVLDVADLCLETQSDDEIFGYRRFLGVQHLAD